MFNKVTIWYIPSIKNETTIDVKNNMEIAYKISCHYDRISVENLYIDIDEEIDFKQAKGKIEEKKKESIKYLKDNLGL